MTAPWRRTLAVFQIAGGALTLAGYVGTLQFSDFRPAAWLVGLALGFSVASLYAGLELLRATPRGLAASMIVQALQVVSISIPDTWRYVFLAGPRVLWVVAGTGTGVHLGGGGEFLVDPTAVDATLKGLGLSLEVNLGIWPHPLADAAWAVGVNGYALLAFVRLWDAYDQITRAKGTGEARAEPPAVAV